MSTAYGLQSAASSANSPMSLTRAVTSIPVWFAQSVRIVAGGHHSLWWGERNPARDDFLECRTVADKVWSAVEPQEVWSWANGWISGNCLARVLTTTLGS